MIIPAETHAFISLRRVTRYAADTENTKHSFVDEATLNMQEEQMLLR